VFSALEDEDINRNQAAIELICDESLRAGEFVELIRGVTGCGPSKTTGIGLAKLTVREAGTARESVYWFSSSWHMNGPCGWDLPLGIRLSPNVRGHLSTYALKRAPFNDIGELRMWLRGLDHSTSLDSEYKVEIHLDPQLEMRDLIQVLLAVSSRTDAKGNVLPWISLVALQIEGDVPIGFVGGASLTPNYHWPPSWDDGEYSERLQKLYTHELTLLHSLQDVDEDAPEDPPLNFPEITLIPLDQMR
jgi:hypothetical protein